MGMDKEHEGSSIPGDGGADGGVGAANRSVGLPGARDSLTEVGDNSLTATMRLVSRDDELQKEKELRELKNAHTGTMHCHHHGVGIVGGGGAQRKLLPPLVQPPSGISQPPGKGCKPSKRVDFIPPHGASTLSGMQEQLDNNIHTKEYDKMSADSVPAELDSSVLSEHMTDDVSARVSGAFHNHDTANHGCVSVQVFCDVMAEHCSFLSVDALAWLGQKCCVPQPLAAAPSGGNVTVQQDNGNFVDYNSVLLYLNRCRDDQAADDVFCSTDISTNMAGTAAVPAGTSAVTEAEIQQTQQYGDLGEGSAALMQHPRIKTLACRQLSSSEPTLVDIGRHVQSDVSAIAAHASPVLSVPKRKRELDNNAQQDHFFQSLLINTTAPVAKPPSSPTILRQRYDDKLLVAIEQEWTNSTFDIARGKWNFDMDAMQTAVNDAMAIEQALGKISTAQVRAWLMCLGMFISC